MRAMQPAPRSRPDGALDAALERIGGSDNNRPDTPDLHVTAVRQLPAVAAELAPFPAALDDRLTRALQSRGIDRLYTHQADAINHALAGRHVVVVTPTASGKTLCYNAPVLNAILRDPSGRALYLFPTKALAQDQLAELQVMFARASRAQQSGHGAFRHPAASSALGQTVREPALRDHRRAARVPRRVRQSSVQRAAAASTHLPALRLESALPVLLGDDREPP
ncbi:MAG: hypothetical protein DMF94_03445 [Acidobacteria bacterium]|nr:MAG: hypothetical protein DMF94_03445 [Acidobacteriota bacterium]